MFSNYEQIIRKYEDSFDRKKKKYRTKGNPINIKQHKQHRNMIVSKKMNDKQTKKIRSQKHQDKTRSTSSDWLFPPVKHPNILRSKIEELEDRIRYTKKNTEFCKKYNENKNKIDELEKNSNFYKTDTKNIQIEIMRLKCDNAFLDYEIELLSDIYFTTDFICKNKIEEKEKELESMKLELGKCNGNPIQYRCDYSYDSYHDPDKVKTY